MSQKREGEGRRNIQQINGSSKSALGDLAVLLGVERPRDRARLGNVPGHGAGELRVGVIGAGLAVDGDGVENRETQADDQTEDRIEEPHDDHDHLDEQDEEGNDGDGDVEVC